MRRLRRRLHTRRMVCKKYSPFSSPDPRTWHAHWSHSSRGRTKFFCERAGRFKIRIRNWNRHMGPCRWESHWKENCQLNFASCALWLGKVHSIIFSVRPLHVARQQDWDLFIQGRSVIFWVKAKEKSHSSARCICIHIITERHISYNILQIHPFQICVTPLDKVISINR